MTSYPHVCVIVPAYNEEVGIEDTIDSIMAQTYPFEFLLVVANNCTDGTVTIVKRMQEKHGSEKLCLLDIPNNPDLKAGALNQGLRYAMEHSSVEIDLVCSTDGDTVIDSHMIEEGVKQFIREPKTGGICSAYRTVKFKDRKLTRWEKFLWRIQNIEFGLANAWRIEMYDSARVLPGVASMYRAEALRDLMSLNKERGLDDGVVWFPHSQVEDYQLTVDLKDIGWHVKSNYDMVSWSDVPLKVFGPGGLWRQRLRWYSGTIDVLMDRKLKRHSRYELFAMFILALNLFLRITLFAAYLVTVAMFGAIQIIPIFFLIPFFVIVMQAYRLHRFGDDVDWVQWTMVWTLVVTELYAAFREVMCAYAICLSLLKPNRGWY